MSRPFLSLCIIAGDEALLPVHEEPLIARLLRSVCFRESGPMFDEIVVGWNGSKKEELVASVAGSSVVLKIVDRPWDDNFAAARQHSFEAASGVWRGYFDTDDVIPEPGHPAIAESLKIDRVDVKSLGTHGGEGGVALRDHLRSLPGRVNSLWLPYHYIVDDDGKCIQRTWHSRFVRWDDGWTWTDAVHEDMLPTGGNTAVIAFNAGMPILHYPVVSAADRTERNFRILERMEVLANKPGNRVDFRLLYGLGTAYYDRRDYGRASAYLKRAIESTTTTLDKFMALLVLAQAELSQRHYQQATVAALLSIESCPEQSEGYFALAETCYHGSNWGGAAYWYEEGRKRPIKPGNLTIDQPLTRQLWPRIFAATAYLRMGNAQRALELATEAVEIRKDPAALAVIRDAELALSRQTAKQSVIELAKYLVLADEQFKADLLVGGCVPPDMQDDPQIAALRTSILTARRAMPVAADMAWANSELEKLPATRRLVGSDLSAHALTREATTTETLAVAAPFRRPGEQPAEYVIDPPRLLGWAEKQMLRVDECFEAKDPQGSSWTFATVRKTVPSGEKKRSVTFFCPQYAEPWGPDTPRQTGVGSSEESVVYLSEHLVDLGFGVEVFAPLNETTTYVRRGVRWRHLREFDHRKPRKVLVCHRSPWVAKQSDLGCERLVVWHQDNWYPQNIWGPAITKKTEQVFVSLWQSQRLMDEGKIADCRGVVFPNAVPAEHMLPSLRSAGERNPHRVIWASNPARGLLKLLDCWPEIRTAVPTATLDAYYGWEVMMALGVTVMPQMLDIRRRLEEYLGALSSHGVTWHSRVGQDELAIEMARSGVMAYSCSDFEEGYGVALTRALAAGVIPVFCATGALPEVQPEQKYMVKGLWEQGAWSEFVRLTVAALNDQDFDRENAWRKVPDWAQVSRAWAAYLSGDGIQTMRRNPEDAKTVTAGEAVA